MNAQVFPDAEERQLASNTLLKKTYKVTIIMLLIGQIQASIVMEIYPLKLFLMENYYLSLVQFFMSFISLQLYIFFYHDIVQTSTLKRFIAGVWTVNYIYTYIYLFNITSMSIVLQFEVNTIAIMKPAKKAYYMSLLFSWVLTAIMMIISIIYADIAFNHKRGLFISRHNVICWSERLFVLTSFGIIVCSEMKRVSIEFPSLFIYCMMSNIFVIIFAASIRKPDFYHLEAKGEHILIGQLYYLNFFALYMSYVWTAEAGYEVIGYKMPF
ncbi:hypothetical protein KR222_008270 [Zaprionus bogoriensis]|nr:hypothetical protein KR222_008270 [Zaprionus bogoriensis]